jgi:hypothetical protein
LPAELRSNIRYLPLQASPAATAKRADLDKLGTELWNLSTRLRRNGPVHSDEHDRHKKTETGDGLAICLLRAYAFLLLDSAGSHKVKGQEHKACIRLMKIALKAAKACVLAKDLDCATKVLERAAAYEEILTGQDQQSEGDDTTIAGRLQLEYFTIRAALVRLDHLAIRDAYTDVRPPGLSSGSP